MNITRKPTLCSMFESFKSRAETIDQEKFDSFLEDPQFKTLIEDVEEKMIFSREGESDEGVPDSFETASGYGHSLGQARNWLDKKGLRISDSALARAIARKMGGEEFAGLVD